MRSPEVHERIRSLGFTLVASTPEAFAQRLRSEFETLRTVGQARKLVITD